MRILVYSEVNAETIASSMGLSEYSYYFVLKEFLPVLRILGEVLVVKDPMREVDRLYADARKAGVHCIFLSFTPPHKTPLGLKCPTIPILAWEFDTIPNEYWLGDRVQDWRYGLRRCGRAITHSQLTVKAIREQMGEGYPVISIPAPIWDKYASLRARLANHGRRERVLLTMQSCVLFDSQDASQACYWPDGQTILASVAGARGESKAGPAADTRLPTVRQQSVLRITYRYLLEWYRQVGRQLPREWLGMAEKLQPPSKVPALPRQLTELWQQRAHCLELSGVIFVSMFNPNDGRKNWADMLTAFCTAFRDCSDATLVFKLGSSEYQEEMSEMLLCMARLPKFSCRVVLLHGFLEGEAFDGLIEASHFVVNASYGEGQCLPLMEFLSCGRPAVAPRNSAMLDYMDEQVGFVVEGWSDTAIWPHDPREAYRALRQQIDWESLVRAYRDAYRCVQEMPERYAELSRNAVARMRKHCSRHIAEAALRSFLIEDWKPC
jgi:glycosyltransferase involved in cell wall biosynthesis